MREKIHNQRPEPTKTYVLYPQIREHINRAIDPEARLEEACGLALAIHIDLVDSKWIKLREIRPATFIGGGLIEELGPVFAEKGIELVIVDANLSPIQQRNLEEKWNIKVIDRTGLILEIFGERASTAEGRLQVELAALQYQKSRLVRSWTHLERQRGGTSTTGGPGESQLEIDKRLIGERITRIEKDLEKVKQRRALHRKSRQKVPYPIVALVGYTNAGKSTLFNSLTKAGVMAEDMLFATLDPTMRLYKLPSGREVILSDTVGFISDLPTQLVAAFRATLEEVLEADLILHVRDSHSKNTNAQAYDVYHVLQDLGLDPTADNTLEIFNKADLLTTDARETLEETRLNKEGTLLFISALEKEGLESVNAEIDSYFDHFTTTRTFNLPASDGKALAWLHAHGNVQSIEENEALLSVTVKLGHREFSQFSQRFL
ncbi:MAG TPA: GTPase HflX [Holosporales bacterium]|nr:GTPase HflX [Holosporales bacterium]